jgi:hypothetical protein
MLLVRGVIINRNSLFVTHERHIRGTKNHYRKAIGILCSISNNNMPVSTSEYHVACLSFAVPFPAFNILQFDRYHALIK